jgi:hypothetical protein
MGEIIDETADRHCERSEATQETDLERERRVLLTFWVAASPRSSQ